MPRSTQILVETGIPVTMRDGTVLYTDVFRPGSWWPLPGFAPTDPV